MVTDASPLDCQSCAACCFSATERYVRVTGRDYARLGDCAEELVQFIGNQAFMRMDRSHCCALTFDEQTQRFACAIYEKRPDICRTLLSGSATCHAERCEKEEFVQLVVARSRHAAAK
jgi:Fe-S-cluster containining protein